jgi:hypothetical protein
MNDKPHWNNKYTEEYINNLNTHNMILNECFDYGVNYKCKICGFKGLLVGDYLANYDVVNLTCGEILAKSIL